VVFVTYQSAREAAPKQARAVPRFGFRVWRFRTAHLKSTNGSAVPEEVHIVPRSGYLAAIAKHAVGGDVEYGTLADLETALGISLNGLMEVE
jgi:hypothetical protein